MGSAAVGANCLVGPFCAPRQQDWTGRCLEEQLRLLHAVFGKRLRLGIGRLGEGPLFAYPARQERLGIVAHPLVEQGRDLAPDVGGVVQARKLKTLQGCDRRIMEEIPRRFTPHAGYGAPRSQLSAP
jgi:hypothetical protein